MGNARALIMELKGKNFVNTMGRKCINDLEESVIEYENRLDKQNSDELKLIETPVTIGYYAFTNVIEDEYFDTLFDGEYYSISKNTEGIYKVELLVKHDSELWNTVIYDLINKLYLNNDDFTNGDIMICISDLNNKLSKKSDNHIEMIQASKDRSDKLPTVINTIKFEGFDFIITNDLHHGEYLELNDTADNLVIKISSIFKLEQILKKLYDIDLSPSNLSTISDVLFSTCSRNKFFKDISKECSQFKEALNKSLRNMHTNSAPTVTELGTRDTSIKDNKTSVIQKRYLYAGYIGGYIFTTDTLQLHQSANELISMCDINTIFKHTFTLKNGDTIKFIINKISIGNTYQVIFTPRITSDVVVNVLNTRQLISCLNKNNDIVNSLVYSEIKQMSILIKNNVSINGM
jgi:hypothetical protein